MDGTQRKATPMSDVTANTIAYETAIESLRQQRETFEQRREQENKWFSLRLRMGYAAVVLLPAVAIVSGYVILNPGSYSTATVTAATGALFVDVLGLMGAIWKVVLNPDTVTKLDPVTDAPNLEKIEANNPPVTLPPPSPAEAPKTVAAEKQTTARDS